MPKSVQDRFKMSVDFGGPCGGLCGGLRIGSHVGWSGPGVGFGINDFQKGGLKGPLLFLLLGLLITIASVRILRIGFL